MSRVDGDYDYDDDAAANECDEIIDHLSHVDVRIPLDDEIDDCIYKNARPGRQIINNVIVKYNSNECRRHCLAYSGQRTAYIAASWRRRATRHNYTETREIHTHTHVPIHKRARTHGYVACVHRQVDTTNVHVHTYTYTYFVSLSFIFQ